MLIQNYTELAISRTGARNDVVCDLRRGAYCKIDNDMRKLFPYINGSVQGARYHYRPLHVAFKREDVRCTLYPKEIIAAPFRGEDHAFEYVEGLIVFLNDMYANRRKYKKSYRVHRKPVSVVEKTASPTGTLYRIQVASFRDLAKANVKMEEIKKKGYRSYIIARDLGEKGTWYRVYVGTFSNKNEAAEHLTKVKADYPDSFLISSGK